MYDIWLFDGFGFSTEYVKLSVKMRLKDIFIQELNSARTENILCVNYNIFKSDWKLEGYLLKLSYHHRLSLSRFRCRSHSLPISHLKYMNDDDDIDILYCKLCREDTEGTEFHYLLICPFFEQERRFYIDENHLLNRDDQTMQLIMNSDETEKLVNLSKFCRLIMEIFNNQDKWDRD